MWVPVISLVWTFVYLMQNRFAPLKITDDDEIDGDENKSDSKKLVDGELKVNTSNSDGENDEEIIESKKSITETDKRKFVEKELIVESEEVNSKQFMIKSEDVKKNEPRKPEHEFGYEKIVESKKPTIETNNEKKLVSKELIVESEKVKSKKCNMKSDDAKEAESTKPKIKADSGKILESKKSVVETDERKLFLKSLISESKKAELKKCAVKSDEVEKESDIQLKYEEKEGLGKPTLEFHDGKNCNLRELQVDTHQGNGTDMTKPLRQNPHENKINPVAEDVISDSSRDNTVNLGASTVGSDDDNKVDSTNLKGECFYNIEEMVTKVTASFPRARINYNTVTLVGLAIGLSGGWTSPFLAKLTSPESELPVTEDEASWIASLIQLGRVVGAVIGSVGVAFFGSKFAVLCTGIPVAVSWIFLILADSVGWVYAARSLQGISTGMFFSTFPMYAGEISHPKMRGAIVGLMINAMAVGFVIGNLLGTLTSMRLFSIICLIPSVAFLVLFAFLPASPQYLVSQSRIDDAAYAIWWYQRDADVVAELESLKRFVDDQREATFRDTLRVLNVPRNRKAFIMVMIVFMLLQVGGTYAMGYYMEIILRRAGVKNVIDPGMAVVVIGCLGLAGGVLAMYANDKFGRKVVLAGSSGGLTISLIVLGVHYVLIEQGYGTVNLEWLPVIILIFFEFFICLGIGPVPSTIVSELFPPRTKSIAACAANMISGLFAFISTKTYQQMVDVMPDQYVFWFYGLMMATLGIYTIISLPETKGKSLQEIQDMLAKR